jgi:hypothetical protein
MQPRDGGGFLMRTQRLTRLAFLAVLLFPIGFTTAAPEPPKTDDKVTLQDIKYDDLGKLIRSNKGKVIVVDFWGEY